MFKSLFKSKSKFSFSNHFSKRFFNQKAINWYLNSTSTSNVGCTINPNVAVVPIHDDRLLKLAEVNKSDSIVQVSMEFVDIAGLIEGASKGEGMGNQFLSNIRSCGMIIQVVRCFLDDSIAYVTSSNQKENITIDPIRDIDTIQTELVLSDLQQLENMLSRVSGKKSPKYAKNVELIEKTVKALEKGTKASEIEMDADDWEIFKNFQLLTLKPICYVCNIGENDVLEGGNQLSKMVLDKYGKESCVVLSAKLESEIANMKEPVQRKEFQELYGVKEGTMTELTHKCLKLLQKVTFYTAGPTQSRAWQINFGTNAKQAAGKIHTDFEKGFICMDQIGYEQLLEIGPFELCQTKNKLNKQSGGYIVKDGDVVLFKFNASK